jgi:hypothetical protein
MADHRHRVRWFCDGFTSVLRWLHIGSAMASHRQVGPRNSLSYSLPLILSGVFIPF